MASVVPSSTAPKIKPTKEPPEVTFLARCNYFTRAIRLVLVVVVSVVVVRVLVVEAVVVVVEEVVVVVVVGVVVLVLLS